MEQEQKQDQWYEEEDRSDDLFMEKMVSASKTFNLVVFVLVILLIIGMTALVLLSKNA